MANTATAPEHKELFGHPIGLYILFFTEMWERFSYYGMRAILVLYLVSATTDGNAGLGWTSAEALALYGWYTMLVYVASIPGGIIADKLESCWYLVMEYLQWKKCGPSIQGSPLLLRELEC